MIVRLAYLLILSIFLLGCGSNSTNTIQTEDWTLIQAKITGESSQVVYDTVQVGNCCGLVEKKTISCSAGTERDLTLAIGATIGLNAGGTITLDPQVSSTLGLTRESGESLELETPPDGETHIYEIEKNYTVSNVDATIRSSSGREEKTGFTFHSDCSLKIISKNTTSCADSCSVSGTPVNDYFVNHQDYFETDLLVEVGDNSVVCITTGPILILDIDESVRFPGNGRGSVVCWIGPQTAHATNLAGSSLKYITIKSGDAQQIALGLMNQYADEMVTRPDGCGISYGPCKVADLALILSDGSVVNPIR